MWNKRGRHMCKKENQPFIHLFETPLGKYLYDVNTDKILKIDSEVYKVLADSEYLASDKTLKYIEDLKKRGYLSSNHVEKTKHPNTDLAETFLNNKLGYLILQVTQNCNLRCEYCIYSGNYHTRKHSNKRMSFDIAKKAIDFFLEHSKERYEISFGFYGGEPLLEFELIKKCVEYIESITYGKKVHYSITTNGTLLKGNILKYIVDHDFLVTISLDGPKEVHNRSRLFVNSNIGSFDTIISNIEEIKKNAIEFYHKNVTFNCVMLGEESFSCVDNYFKGDELFKDVLFTMSTVSTSFSKNNFGLCDEFLQQHQYELFKLYLKRLGRLKDFQNSVLLDGYFKRLDTFAFVKKVATRQKLPREWHRGGPCVPGYNRLFVTVDGDFLPCEKVCEIASISKIGSVDEGFLINKIKKILNIERFTEEACHNCWAYSECTSCIQCCDDKDDTITTNLLHRCKEVKFDVDNLMKDYTVLCELGYDYECFE